LTPLFQDGGYDVKLRNKVPCCHLVSENETSPTRICSNARQFLTCSTFVTYLLDQELISYRYSSCCFCWGNALR